MNNTEQLETRLYVLEQQVQLMQDRLKTLEEQSQDGRYIADKGESGRRNSIEYLAGFFHDVQHITICDPYFLLPARHKPVVDYATELDQVFPDSLRSLELFVKPSTRDGEVGDLLNAFCEAHNIAVAVYETNEIHDRIWIKDTFSAYIVGTSFNGLGHKFSFILPLPNEDLKQFQQELQEIRMKAPKKDRI